MDDFGRILEPGVVRFERLLPGPVERVWAYLTEADKRARWFAGGEMDLRPGGEVRLLFRNGEFDDAPPPEKHRAHAGEIASGGTITRCEPPSVLAFLWGEEDGSQSEVTFELFPRNEEVLLVLTHGRLADRTLVLDVSGGWHAHLARLEDELRGREARPFWATLAAAEAEYAQRYSG